jgi:hypothetical protein
MSSQAMLPSMQDCVRTSPDDAEECSQCRLASSSSRRAPVHVIGWCGEKDPSPPALLSHNRDEPALLLKDRVDLVEQRIQVCEAIRVVIPGYSVVSTWRRGRLVVPSLQPVLSHDPPITWSVYLADEPL